MRDIKFRAWDDMKKRMIPWEEMLKHKGAMWSVFAGGKITRYEHQHDEQGVTSDLFIPLQFTGLCDKNGKKIYEGDIVKCSGLTLPITVDDFHGYRFMFGLDDLTRHVGVYGEVIGNIYENPELVQR